MTDSLVQVSDQSYIDAPRLKLRSKLLEFRRRPIPQHHLTDVRSDIQVSLGQRPGHRPRAEHQQTAAVLTTQPLRRQCEIPGSLPGGDGRAIADSRNRCGVLVDP